MRAVDFALAQGQAAIVLVPEIALTPQTVRRFAARFPGRVALIHSRLSEVSVTTHGVERVEGCLTSSSGRAAHCLRRWIM